jgi:transposase
MGVKMLYPEEFRKKVLEYIDGFHTQSEVAKMFKINPKTVWSWVKQRKKTGSLKPKKPVRKARKLEKEALLQYVREHPDAYLREIGEHFGCVISAVHQRLKNFGITYKKTVVIQRKRREASTRISE